VEQQTMNTFLNLTVYGLSDGAILALAALGFVLIYKSTSVINFAQGELLLIGGYTVYSTFVVFRLPLVLAVGVGIVIAVLLGLLIERLVLRPLIGENPISVIMVTIGLAALLRAVVQLIFGTRPVSQPDLMPRTPVQLAPDTFVPLNRLLVVGVAAVVLVAFTLFFRRSRHGIAMRAVADDQQAALTVGISVRRVFALAWALAAVSALIGGVMLADVTEVSGRLATFGLLVFPVVILGGLDSVPGTIVGGLTVGLSAQYVSGYWDPGLAQIAPYLLLVAILLVRPYGLFGETRIERV
jgi:branched-chain amino acid transport system permease protein